MAKHIVDIKIKNNAMALRKEYKLSRAKVAELCGITYGAYYSIEKGKAIPNLKTAFAIAKALNVRIDKLFFVSIYEKY